MLQLRYGFHVLPRRDDQRCRLRHRLVEKLAAEIAALCLEERAVAEVQVMVEKPGALRFARSVGVEITRSRRAATGRQQ